MRLYDAIPEQVVQALDSIEQQLSKLDTEGNLRGNMTADDQRKNITGYSSLDECLEGVFYIQVEKNA